MGTYRITVLVALALVIVLNIVGVNHVDIMFYGVFVLMAIFGLIAIQFVKFGRVVLLSFVLSSLSVICKLSIDVFFDYDTIAYDGNVIPMEILVLAGFMTIATSMLIAMLFAGIGLLFKRKVHT